MTYSIGVDIGGTNIRIALVDSEGNIIKVIKESTKKENLEESLVSQVCELYKKLDVDNYEIVGMGVGVPGPVNSKTGYVYTMPNLNIDDIALKEILEEKLKIRVEVGNDANVAGLAEAIVGNGKNSQIVQYLTLSTGVGGGLVIDKKMISGKYGFAQEVGSMVIEKGGRNPHNGKANGCIEAIGSGTAIVALANEAGLNISHAGELFTLAEEKNQTAIDVKAVWIDNMAAFLGSIVSYIEPDIFVLGGGLMKSANYFLEELVKKVDDYVFDYLKGKINIVIAKYDQDAGIIGSAMLVY